METKKLKGKLREIGIGQGAASDFWSSKTDPTYSPSKTKKKVMSLQIKKKLVSEKPKCLKSKDKKVWSDRSMKSRSIARKRTRYSDMYDDIEAKFSVMERAERVLSQLENGLPYFVKCMLPSNVAHGFWLHLPKKFCSLHFPSHDSTIVLVDEWGNEYKTSYLLERHGLSAGWRGFSISHRLLKGDILIFHLTEPCKLKVHIVRVNGSEVVGAALCLMNLDTSSEDVLKNNRKRKQMKYVEPFVVDISACHENARAKIATNSNLGPLAYQSENNSHGYSSVVT